MAPSAAGILDVLRSTDNFQWYVIPLFALVVYVYAVEAEKKNFAIILGGLAWWGMDWFNEIVNSIIFHVTGFAPLWGVAKSSAYVILIGLNIEICFMFAVAPIAFIKLLPADKAMKILGIPNRWFMIVFGSLFCVFVEILLNLAGALTWEWSFWNAHFPVLIVLFGYMTFFIAAFMVYDMKSMRSRLLTVSAIYGVDLALLCIFGCWLGWL
ncbi:MAG: hypothetical protein AB1921_09670 [Thermodesulfobacteriota bacterium]